MSDNLPVIFQKELDKGEHILWTGQPRQGLFVEAADVGVMLIGMVGVFFVFVMVAEATSSGSWISVMLGVLGTIGFGLLSFYLIAGRLLIDMWRRRISYYALTDQRIIIIVNLIILGASRSLWLESLPEMTLEDLNNRGQGTIVIGQPGNELDMGRRGDFDWSTLQSRTVRLEMIDDVHNIYDQILEAQNKVKREPENP